MVLMVGFFRPDLLDATLVFTGAFLSTAAWVLFGAAVLFIVVAGALTGWAWWHGKSVESLRQRDGHYPVQRVKLKDGRIVYIDLNQVVGPALTVDRRTGEISEHEPAAGWQVQSVVRALVEQTRRAQAMFQGDASRSTQWGSQHKGDRITAAAAKLTAGGYDSRKPAIELNTAPPVDSTPAPQIEAPRTWGVRDAFQNNTNTMLVLGQTDAGQLVYWDMPDAPFLRVHGKMQGSGKTNVCQTIAAGAARLGAHVIIADNRSFKDWAEFRGIAELVDTTDPRMLAKAVQELHRELRRRDQLLGQHGAANISYLPQPPRRVVMIVSEFGALCEEADEEGVLDDVINPLKQMARKAGADGIHLVFEDQVVHKWPRAIAANAEPIIGRMPAYAGQACGYIGRGGKTTADLEPYSFYFEGAVFKTFHMRPALRGLLAAAPDLGETLVSVVPVSSSNQRSTVPITIDGGVSPEVERQNGTQNVPLGTVSGPDDPGRWEDVVAAWFATHPAAKTGPALGISDLARAMCRDNEGNDANYEAYKGRAHKLFHDYRKTVTA